MSYRFLSLADILEAHRQQLALYGGSAGVRDRGLLESALAQPAATFAGEYLHHDVYEMAAAYLYHLAQNHPFVDGNKRTAAFAAILFLHRQGLYLNPTETVFERLVLSVARGETDKPAIADFLRNNSQPRPAK